MRNIYFGNARTALKVGLHRLGLSSGDRILVPDLICDVVIEAVLSAGIEVNFYNLNKNFSPNWLYLQKLVDSQKFSAIIKVNYFGSQKYIEEYLNFSRKNNLFLIEDSAHSIENFRYGCSIIGDLQIKSPRKLFSVFSGGILSIPDKNNDVENESPNIKFMPDMADLAKLLLSTLMPSLMHKIKALLPEYTKNGNEKHKDKSIDIFSFFALTWLSWEKAGQRRCDRWARWDQYFKQTKQITESLVELGGTTIPWVYPLRVHSEEEINIVKERLEKSNVTVFPWPKMVTKCTDNQDGFSQILCIRLDRDPKWDVLWN